MSNPTARRFWKRWLGMLPAAFRNLKIALLVAATLLVVGPIILAVLWLVPILVIAFAAVCLFILYKILLDDDSKRG